MGTVSRRTLLKAAGVSLSLPMLESMAKTNQDKATEPPKRAVFICTALGLYPNHLWPKTTGKDYELTPYLKRLEKHRDDFTLFSGLQHEDQTGRQPHDSEMTWLTAARKPGLGGFRNTVSIDQVAAEQMGNQTRFRSLSLGTMKSQSQSFTKTGVMIPSKISPAKLFADLFLQGKPHELRAQRQRLNDGKSILDELGSQAKSLRRQASSKDNHLLDDYFDSVRDVEKNISSSLGWLQKPKPIVEARQPADIPNPADFLGRIRLMMDMIPLVVQTDSSRVITLMIQDHYVVPTIEGVSGNHHNLSHHGQDESKIQQLQKIENGIIDCYGELLTKMKSKTESEQSLLDHTSILFGSNLGNANAHHAKNLPIFLAGGSFDHGRYIAKKEGTPLCNLFVTMMQDLGLELDSFGQSTGTVSW